jgi:protoporphyrinogen oxidase
MNASDRRTVAVIGGGYTGLAAALRLAQQGHQVAVFEASENVGGLTSDFSIAGKSLEKAYHHIFRTDTSVISLANELGIGSTLQWHVSKTAIFYNGAMHPFAGALDLLRFSPLPFFDRLRTGLVALRLQHTRRWKQFEGVSAMDWMKRKAGTRATEVIWEPLLRGKYGEYADSVSMCWLWSRLYARANSKARGELTERLGYFMGGFDVLTQAIVEACSKLGTTVRTSTPVDALKGSKTGVSVTVAGKDITFDACLVTIPSPVFARLVEASSDASDAYLDQLRSVPYLGARVLIFASDQGLSDAYWHNINDVEKPFVVMIQHDNLVADDRYGTHIYYLGTYCAMNSKTFTAETENLADEWLTALKEIFPAFDRGRVSELHDFRLGYAQHVVDTDYASRIPNVSTPIPGVFLSNFAQIYPEDRGTNFAIRAGEEAAKVVDDFLR